MTVVDELRPWQRGIPLEELRAAAAPFRAHDEGLILGAFTAVNESRIAAWLAERRVLRHSLGDGTVSLICRALARPLRVVDFRGRSPCTLPAQAVLVERLGYTDAAGETAALDALQSLGQAAPLAVWAWQEHAGDRRLVDALGLTQAAVKIRASSEILGLWVSPALDHEPLPCREQLGLVRLNLPALDVEPLRAALAAAVINWAQHYSSYNERGSWTALALRGFSDDPTDIEKPAEMSRKWKAEHPERLADPVRDTPLRAVLPEAEPLIAAVPGPKERIRLMRLAGGGGLSRHADIVDPDAGAQPGQVLRIHVPIVSEPTCQFRSWRPSGERDEAHMATGEAWWLDTRKPHQAKNPGEVERIHLVLDTIATDELLELLPC